MAGTHPAKKLHGEDLLGEVVIYDRDDDASRAGADQLADLARDAVAQRGRFDVALSGGDTPRAMYELLAEPPLRDRIPWAQVHVFWGDERGVPPDHPRSNFGMAHEAFLSRVPVPVANLHRMRGELDAREAAARYAEELHAHFGEPWPRFDLAHLGIGEDGHTASLYPGAAELDIVDRAVVASLDRENDEPRITLTFPAINAAAQVELLVLEGEKATLVAELIARTERSRRYPAARVRPRGRLVWRLGRAAAQQVPR